ncbi:hypothetical protein [Paenibacillus harenae]|nr:hypothetical protein [Paenibacillus harenae]MDQ0062362.1 hypothetical protein [Paenibacillus harenae]
MIAYRLKVGSFTCQRRMPFIEAEHMKKKLDKHVRDVVIIAERE